MRVSRRRRKQLRRATSADNPRSDRLLNAVSERLEERVMLAACHFASGIYACQLSDGDDFVSFSVQGTSVKVQGSEGNQEFDIPSFALSSSDRLEIDAGEGDDIIDVSGLAGFSGPISVMAGDGLDTIRAIANDELTVSATEVQIAGKTIGFADVEVAALRGGSVQDSGFAGAVISAAGVPDWTPQGPGPIVSSSVGQDTGAIQAVVVHPDDDDIVYVGTVGGGIWKTEEARVANPEWKPLTDQFPSLATVDLAIDPSNPEILYASTGPTSSSDLGGGAIGVLKSVDGGENWTLLDEFFDEHITVVPLPAPAGGQGRVLAVNGDILVNSPESPETFQNISLGGNLRDDDGDNQVDEPDEGLPTGATDLAYDFTDGNQDRHIDPGDQLRLYAAIAGEQRQAGRVQFDPSDIDVAGDRISYSAHGIAGVVGPLTFDRESDPSATLPTPLMFGAEYFVGEVDDNTLEIRATANGPAIDLTSQGSTTGFFHLEAELPPSGVYRSDDGGQTWTHTSNGLLRTDTAKQIELTVSTAGNHAVYAAVIEHPQTKLVRAPGVTTGPAATAMSNTIRVQDASLFNAESGDRRSRDSIKIGTGASEETRKIVSIDRSQTPPVLTLDAALSINHQPDEVVIAKDELRVSGVFRSTDFGQTWTSMGIPGDADGGINPGGQGENHFSIVADPYHDNIVYVGGDRQPAPSGFPNMVGARDYSGRLFMGTIDGTGNTQWAPITHNGASGTAPHADSRDMVFDSQGDILQVDDGGIYRLSNVSHLYDANPNTQPAWAPTNGNMALTEFYDVSWDVDTKRILGGSQDNGTVRQDSQGATQWKEIGGGDGAFVAVAGGNILYSSQYLRGFQVSCVSAACSVPTGSGPLMPTTTPALRVSGSSTRGGTNLSLEDFDDTLQFIQPFAVNSVGVTGTPQPDSTRLLIGTDYLYESTDSGQTLSLLGGSPNPNGSTFVPPPAAAVGTVNALVYGGLQPMGGSSMLKPNVGYVGTDSVSRSVMVDGKTETLQVGLFVRKDGANVGDPFVPVGKFAKDSGGLGVRDVAVDPLDWRRVYVLDNSGEVWFSANAGDTWSSITGRLESLAFDYPTNWRTIAVVRPPGLSGTDDPVLLVGGEGGVYRRVGGSGRPARWAEFGGGLPNTIVTDIEYNAADDVLLAGTLGRGAWTIPRANHSLLQRPELRAEGSDAEDDTPFTLDDIDERFFVERNASHPWMLDVYYCHCNDSETPARPVLSVPISSLEHVQLNGNGGDDDFVIDYTNGPVSGEAGPIQIAVDGGNDGDDGTNRVFVLGNLDTYDNTGATDVGQVVVANDPFGKRSKQVVVWQNVDEHTGTAATTASLAPISAGLQSTALAFQQTSHALRDTELAVLGARSLGSALSGRRVSAPRPKDDPFVTVAQVNPRSSSQRNDGMSVLRRIIEESPAGFELSQIGEGRAIDTPESLRQALDNLDGVDGNVTFVEADRDGDGTTDWRFDVQIDSARLDGIADLDVDANLVDVLGGQVSLAGSLEIAMDVDLQLTFGVDSTGFFVEPDPDEPELRVSNIQVNGEVAGSGRLGLLGVDVTDLNLTFDPNATIDVNLIAPESELLRPSDMRPDDVSELISVDVSGDPTDSSNDDVVLAGTFDVTAIVPGLDTPIDLAGASLTVAWPDLASPANVIVTANNANGAEALEFIDLSPASLLERLDFVRDRIEQIFAPLLDIDLPFLRSASDDPGGGPSESLRLGQVLDVADGYTAGLFDLLQLAPDGLVPFPRFDTLQHVASSVIGSSGFRLLGLDLFDPAVLEVVSYEPSTGILQFDVPLSHQFAPLSTQIELPDVEGSSLTVGPIDVELLVTMGADLSFGFDLDELASPVDSFFFNVSEVSANLRATASDIDVLGEMGLLDFSIEDGAVVLDATVSVPITDPTPETRMSLVDLQTIVTNTANNPTTPSFVNVILDTKVFAASGTVGAFLGTKDDAGNPSTGVQLTNGQLALGIFHSLDLGVLAGAPVEPPTVALDLSAEAQLVGMEDALRVSGTAHVRVNNTGEAVSEPCIGGSEESGACVGGAGELAFSASEGDVQSVVVSGELEISEFATLTGELAFDLDEEIITTTPTDGSAPVEVSVLKLGASDIHGFVGVSGPYWIDSNEDGTIDGEDTPSSEAAGLALGAMSFGLAVMTPTNSNDQRRYYALQSNTDSIQLVGIDDLQLAAADLSLTANGAVDLDANDVAALDLSLSPIEVPTGEDDGESTTLEFDSEHFSLSSFVGMGVGPVTVVGNFAGAIEDEVLTLEVRDLVGDVEGFNLASVLPLAIERVQLEFPDAYDLDALTLSAEGRFFLDDGSALAQLPFTPIIHIGDPNDVGGGEATSFSAEDNGAFQFTVAVDSLSQGEIRPVDFGPITLGFQDLSLQAEGTTNNGDANNPTAIDEAATASGQITLGGYQQGEFQGDVVGSVMASVPSLGDVSVDLTGTIDFETGGVTSVALMGTALANASVGGDSASFAVDGAEVDFNLALTATPQPAPDFVSLSVSADIDSLSVDQFVVEVGEMMVLSAEGINVDFDAPPDQALATLDNVTVEFPSLPFFEAGMIDGVELYSDRIEIASASVTLDGAIGSNPRLAELTDTEIQITNIGFNFETGQLVPITGQSTIGDITVTADSATLFPDLGDEGLATVNLFNGTFDFQGNIAITVGCDLTAGDGEEDDFPLCADPNDRPDGLSANLFDILDVTATTGRLNLGPDFENEPLFEVGIASLSMPVLAEDIHLELENLQLDRSGQFSLTRASLLAENRLGIGEFLPFDFTEITMESIDSGPITLDEFDLTLAGTFDLSIFGADFVDPFIRVGDQDPDDEEDTFDVTFRYQNNTVSIQNTGPIELGFTGLEVGEMVLEGSIELGGYVDGEFQTQVGGHIALDATSAEQLVSESASDDPTPDEFDGDLGVSFEGLTIDLAGTFTPGAFNDDNPGVTQLSLDGSSDVKLRFNVGELLELFGVNFSFHVDISNPDGEFAPVIEPRLDNLGVDYLRVAIPELFAVTATDATLNFTREEDQPLGVVESVGIDFPDLVGMGGELDFGDEGLQILEDGIIDFGALQGIDITFDAEAGSLINEAFQFLPVEMERLGIRFKEDSDDGTQQGFFTIIQQIQRNGFDDFETQD